MARDRGGIDAGSAFESTADVPLHANGYYLTQADLLATTTPPQNRHVTWLLYVAETKQRYYIKPQAECVVNGNPATRAQWGSLLTHYNPAGGLTLEEQQQLGLLKSVFGFDYDNKPHGYDTLVEAVGQGLQTTYYRTEQLIEQNVTFDSGRLIGNGANIYVFGDTTLVQLLCDTDNVSLQGSDAMCELAGSNHFRLDLGVPTRVPAGQTPVLSYCTIRQPLTVAQGGIVYLRPGTTTQDSWPVGLQQQSDGAYVTNEGGLVYDQRGSSNNSGGPVPDLTNYYTKAQSDTRYPQLDGSGKVPAGNLPTTLVELNVVFPVAGAQAQDLYINQARLVGTVSLSSATAAMLNLSFKKNGVLVSLPTPVVLGDKLTVSATTDAAGGLVVLTVS